MSTARDRRRVRGIAGRAIEILRREGLGAPWFKVRAAAPRPRALPVFPRCGLLNVIRAMRHDGLVVGFAAAENALERMYRLPAWEVAR